MIRSINRIHGSRMGGSERGFVLVSALVLAVLFFGLIELTLLDSSTRLESAQRFRSRIAARILAENGAELAARNMVNASSTTGEAEIDGGSFEGSYERSADSFVLRGRGHASGARQSSAGIELVGRIEDRTVWIDSSRQLP